MLSFSEREDKLHKARHIFGIAAEMIDSKEGNEEEFEKEVTKIVNLSISSRDIKESFENKYPNANYRSCIRHVNDFMHGKKDYESLTKEELDLLDSRQCELEINEMILKLRYLQKRYHCFDKYQLMSNARVLEKDNPQIKLSEIEEIAGVPKGNSSRYENVKQNVMPTVDYVCALAKSYNVSVDDLLYSDFSKASAQERYIYDFVHKLYNETAYFKEKLLIWKKSPYFNDTLPEYLIDEDCIISPVYNTTEDDPEGKFEFVSSYYKGDSKVAGTVYYAKLPNHNLIEIYIIPCIFNEKNYYELYIYDRESKIENYYRKKPVCNTLEMNKTVVNMVRQLYEAAEKDVVNIPLDMSTRNIIDNYMSD